MGNKCVQQLINRRKKQQLFFLSALSYITFYIFNRNAPFTYVYLSKYLMLSTVWINDGSNKEKLVGGNVFCTSFF